MASSIKLPTMDQTDEIRDEKSVDDFALADQSMMDDKTKDELARTANLDSSESSGEEKTPKEDVVSSSVNQYDTFGVRQAKRMARNPCTYLLVALGVSIVLSALAMTVGDFSVAIDNAGWWSRGTLISNRQTQIMLTDSYQEYLFYFGEEAWDELLNNVQPGWESSDDDGDENGEGGEIDDDVLSRRKKRVLSIGSSHFKDTDKVVKSQRKMPFRHHTHTYTRHLIENSTFLEGCDTSFYTNWTSLERTSRLWPVWKTASPQYEFMDTDVFQDLCVAETNTQKVLKDEGLCFGCEQGCLPPYSVVLFARLSIENGFTMACDELSQNWDEFKNQYEDSWVTCVEEIKDVYDPAVGDESIPEACPKGFHPSFVQDDFDITDWKTFTSSIFATRKEDTNELYDIVDQFDRGTDRISGSYDTQREDFGIIFTESVLGSDMALAMGSAVVTVVAMLIHTRSPFLTGIGLLQIILTFPLSYFVYTFIARLEFFPFLNFIAVFVLFALGADHIFVAVDKWKNARIDNPKASLEDIAGIALPDATAAMFLTTLTTAIAFFGTAICPVAPIKMFAIFCGLLISIDYLMCILLIFPALCIYDKSLTSGKKNYCVSCHCCSRTEAADDEADGDLDEDDKSKQSLIRRMLLVYYHFLHKFRFLVLILALTALSLCIWKSTTLELPVTADVRILDEDNEYERNYQWRQELLSTSLEKSGGSTAMLAFGVTPEDTGNQSKLIRDIIKLKGNCLIEQ